MIPSIEDSKSQDKQKMNVKQQALIKTKVQCQSIFLIITSKSKNHQTKIIQNQLTGFVFLRITNKQSKEAQS